MRLLRWVTAVVVVAVLGWVGNAGADESSHERERDRGTAQGRVRAEPPVKSAKPARSAKYERNHARTTKRRPAAKTSLVSRVIDGDTVELANGQDVRLVGIDTPEVGECGYEKASVALVRLVEGKQVRLTRSDEDRDQYGRLLRYVDVGDVDAGLRLIRNGLAIARYDSRDGYGYHRREPVYVAADRGAADLRCHQPQPLVSAAPTRGCAPGYTPCVPLSPPDVDCADLDGPVRVTGTDPHALDGDADGVACE